MVVFALDRGGGTLTKYRTQECSAGQPRRGWPAAVAAGRKGGLKDLDLWTAQEEARQWGRRLGIEASKRLVEEFDGAGKPARGPIDVVDLFCGCGGFSVGFEFVGRLEPSYRLAGAVDNDPYCIETYASNLPARPVLADLAHATGTAARMTRLIERLGLRPTAPLIVIGGPPCQGFSAHRKKHGTRSDDRNNLVLAFARAVKRLRPAFVVFENVPEVLAQKHWRYFEEMRTLLSKSGYIVRAQIHNLAGFAVPQARFRALIIAARRPFAMPKPFLEAEEFHTVRDAIGDLPAVKPGEVLKSDPMHFCTRHRRSTIETVRKVPKNGGRRPTGVGPKCLDRVDGFRDVYGRMYWDRPANTITAYARNPASGRYVHPEQDRGLTIREAALLQAFPRTYVFQGPFDHRFGQIGNAVPPVFAAYVAAHILGELRASQIASDMDDRKEADVVLPTSNSFSSGIAGRKRGLGLGR